MDLESRVADLERRVTILEGNTGPVPVTPPHIDLDTDATQPLTDWFKTLEPGTVADLQARPYKVDQSLILEGLAGLDIRNVSLDVSAPPPTLDSQGRSTRRHLWLKQCTDVTLDQITITGGNLTNNDGDPAGPDDQAAYHGNMAFEHAIAIQHSDRVTVTNLTVDAVFGDGFYIQRAHNIHLDGYEVSRNGRQGIAASAGTNLKFFNGVIRHSRRSGIDLEPNMSYDTIRGVEIGNMRIRSRLFPLTSGGPGVVSDVHVHDIEIRAAAVLSIVPGGDGRRDNWTIERYTFDGLLGSPSYGFNVWNADNFTLRDFHAPCAPNRKMTGIGFVDAGRVHLERVRMPGATRLAEIRSAAANHELTIIDCIPEA